MWPEKLACNNIIVIMCFGESYQNEWLPRTRRCWEREENRADIPRGDSRGAYYALDTCAHFSNIISMSRPAACLLSVSRISRAISIAIAIASKKPAVNDQRMKAARKSSLIIIKACDLDGAEIQIDVEYSWQNRIHTNIFSRHNFPSSYDDIFL